MNLPIELQFGSIHLPIHAVLELLAFFIGYRYFLQINKTSKHTALPPQIEVYIIVGMATGAFFGSRFIAALENPLLFIDPPSWTYYIGNQTILGGLAGGIAGVEIAKKFLRVSTRTGDLFVYPLILGMIIGRIGCLLTGVTDGTVGLPSDLPWAFDQGDGLTRHPTSAYEILFLFGIWIFLKKISQNLSLEKGDIFRIFIISYSCFRFVVEFLKPSYAIILYLSPIQLLCLLLIAIYSYRFIELFIFQLSSGGKYHE